jgi:hypothetical protein
VQVGAADATPLDPDYEVAGAAFRISHRLDGQRPAGPPKYGGSHIALLT